MKPKKLVDESLHQERDLELVDKRILSYIATAVAKSSKAVDSRALKKTSPTITKLVKTVKDLVLGAGLLGKSVVTGEIVADSASFKKIVKVVSEAGDIGRLTTRLFKTNKAIIRELKAEVVLAKTAHLAEVTATSGEVTLESADISRLTASDTTTKSLSTGGLTAESAKINSIRSNRHCTKDVIADAVTTKNLSSELASISELDCEEVTSNTGTFTNIAASSVKTNALTTSNITASTLNTMKVDDLRSLVDELLKAVPNPELSIAMLGGGKVSSLGIGELFKSEEFLEALEGFCSRYLLHTSKATQRVEGAIRFGGECGLSIDPKYGVKIVGPTNIAGVSIVDGEVPVKPKVFATTKHLAKEAPRTLGIVGKELKCVLPDGSISQSGDSGNAKAKFITVPLANKAPNGYYKLEKLPINPNSAIIQVRDRKNKNSIVEFESYSENSVLYIKAIGEGKYFASLFGE